jgi:Lar family restriction alleviation protein
MNDTTHEPPELLPCPFCGCAARYYHRPDTTGWRNTEWVCCSGDCGASTCMHETKEEAIAAWNTRSDDLVQAAVAAKLREAALIARASFDGEIGYDEILDLITPDAQAALDRVVAAEREHGFWAGRSCGGSKVEIDAALADLRKGGE